MMFSIVCIEFVWIMMDVRITAYVWDETQSDSYILISEIKW